MRTIYKTSFRLGQSGKAADLDQLVEVASEWVGRAFSRVSLENFPQGMELNEGDLALRTLRAEDGGARYFGMRLEHGDGQRRDFRWQTTLAAVHDGDQQLVDIELATGWKSGMMLPVRIDITRPMLVPKLIDRLGAQYDYELMTRARVVRDQGTKEFIDMVCDRRRKLPIVMVSAEGFTDKPIVDADRIAYKLAGIAHVFVAENRWPSFQITQRLGPNLTCYDGAVRLYWPIGDLSEKVFHPLWKREDIMPSTFADYLLTTIAQFSIGRQSDISFDRVRRASASQRLGQLRADKDYEGLATAYALENDNLKGEVGELNALLAAQGDELMTARLKAEALQAALDRKQGPSPVPCAIPEFATVDDVAAYFTEQYAERGVVLAPRVRRAMAQSVFQNPKMVFDALVWLAHFYVPSKRGEMSVDLGESIRQLPGLDYVPFQAEADIHCYHGDYHVPWGGRQQVLHEHIGHGTSRRPEETFRMGFFFDPESRQVVIGYFGQHPQTRSS
ncbi:MAG: hypothetical protein V1735_01095 [Nanoarchaeota archaeon]